MGFKELYQEVGNVLSGVPRINLASSKATGAVSWDMESSGGDDVGGMLGQI